MPHPHSFIPFCILILPLMAVSQPMGVAPSKESLLQREKIVQEKRVIRDGKEYRLYKYALGGNESWAELVFGPDSNLVESIPGIGRRVIGADIARLLPKLGPDGKLKVILVPRIEDGWESEAGDPVEDDQSIEARFFQGTTTYSLNGSAIGLPGMRSLQSRMESVGRERYSKRQKRRDQFGRSVLDRHPSLKKGLKEGKGDALHLSLTREDFEYLRTHSEDFESVEEFVSPVSDFDGEVGTDFAVAFNSSGLVNMNQSNRGSGVQIYLTEAGNCPDGGWVSNYVKLGGISDSHVKLVTSILRAAAPLAKIQCNVNGPENLGFSAPAGTHILTASFSYPNSTNTYAYQDRDWDDFVFNTGIAAFNSGSNTGEKPECNGSTSVCHQVAGPARGYNVLHIGNSSNATSPDTRFSASPWRNPNTKAEKPDFVINGGDFRPYCISSDCKDYKNYGTSGATPHAAGLAADLLSSVNGLSFKPEWLRAYLAVGAIGVLSDNNCPNIASLSGGDCNVGPGGLRFEQTLTGVGGKNWRGTDNGAFGRFDSQSHGDPIPGNGKVDWNTWLDASVSRVRIALTWLTRGSYIYSHVNDPNPIGTDLDFTVYDPDGNVVTGSFSWNNSIEMVEFDPVKSGAYRISIHRFANRDAGARTIMSVAVRAW